MVEVASESCYRVYFFWRRGDIIIRGVGGEEGGVQSDPRGSAVVLPLVRCNCRYFEGGSTLGSFTIDTNASSPSDGKFRLQM